MPFESTWLYDKNGRKIAPHTLVDNLGNTVDDVNEPADIAPLKTCFDNRDEADPTAFENVEEMVSGDTNSAHFSKLSATVKNTRYLNKELEKKISLHKGDEAPTDGSELWIDTSAGETFNIPEIDDNNVSLVDTWSSAKIKEMIDDAGVIVTMEEYNNLTEEEKASGTYFISDMDVVPNAATLDYDNGNSGIKAENVQDAIDTALSRPVNNNLLINSNFANPVNQRAQTEYTGIGQKLYTIDRWYTFNSIVSKCDGYVKVTSNNKRLQIAQKMDGVSNFSNMTIIGSVKYRVNKFNGTGTSDAPVPKLIYQIENTANEVVYFSENLVCDGEWHVTHVVATVLPDCNMVSINICGNTDDDIDIEWVKTEKGSVATPYVPRPYDEELQLCKRYYRLVGCCIPPYLIQNDSIHFTISSYDKYFGMIQRPTGIVLDSYIMNNASTQSGFVASVDSMGAYRMNYSFSKSAHGLTDKINILGEVHAALDAEL